MYSDEIQYYIGGAGIFLNLGLLINTLTRPAYGRCPVLINPVGLRLELYTPRTIRECPNS